MTTISENAFQDALATALEQLEDELELDDGSTVAVTGVRSFDAAGVMTYNAGLVLTLANGAVFQLTIVKDTRHAEREV